VDNTVQYLHSLIYFTIKITRSVSIKSKFFFGNLTAGGNDSIDSTWSLILYKMVLTKQTAFIKIRKLYTSRVSGDSVQVHFCSLYVIQKQKPIFFNNCICGLCLQRRSIPRPSLFAQVSSWSTTNHLCVMFHPGSGKASIAQWRKCEIRNVFTVLCELNMYVWYYLNQIHALKGHTEYY